MQKATALALVLVIIVGQALGGDSDGSSAQSSANASANASSSASSGSSGDGSSGSGASGSASGGAASGATGGATGGAIEGATGGATGGITGGATSGVAGGVLGGSGSGAGGLAGIISGVGGVLGTLNHLGGDKDKKDKGFKCTPYGLNMSTSCGNRALPPLEALCLAHCYSCQDDGTLPRSKRQAPLGSLGDVLQPVQGLPLPLDGAPGVPRGTPLPGDIGPLSLTVLQRCLLQCIVSLNLVGECNVNLIVTELLTICPHANLEVCCASACACCSNDADSSNKCLDVCLQYLPPKISVGDVSVGLGDTFDLPLVK